MTGRKSRTYQGPSLTFHANETTRITLQSYYRYGTIHIGLSESVQVPLRPWWHRPKRRVTLPYYTFRKMLQYLPEYLTDVRKHARKNIKWQVESYGPIEHEMKKEFSNEDSIESEAKSPSAITNGVETMIQIEEETVRSDLIKND